MNNKGTMEQKNKILPELRFPEFVKDGDWEIKTVSEVAYYENGKAHEQDIVIDGKYIVVNSKFISTDGEVVKFTNEALCLAEENDILMVLSDVPNGRAIAKCFYVDKNNLYTVNQRICKLKPFDINGKILYYLLNRNPYFLAFDDGVKQTNLKNNDVLDCPITLPKKTKDSSKEQQKIADCLSSLDELITAHNDKLESLKNHKKGLLQNLLYQTIRFKQINNQSYEDWKFVRFTDCCELIHGFQFREEHFTEKGIPIIKIGSLVDNGCLTFNNATYVDEKYRNSFSKFELKKGDILMALTGGTLGKVSRINDDYGLIFQNYRVGKFEPKDNAIKDFIYYILQSSLVQNKVKSLVNEAAQPNFGKQDFDKIEFFLPTIQEQQKIADCLTAVDHLITAQTEKIEQLKAHKKGLMQGLFPKIEE